ncbi:MAG: Gfo/Idh/MocA family oxidoreductase [Planctomycetes bacterium]|nr:Gfo/Idh/MocA family oxidoreductase [Planctomycetota bacterium]
MEKTKPIGLGLIGCGGFGTFCLEAFSTMPQVRIAAVADVRKEVADLTARQFNTRAFYKAQDLFNQADVDLVHIATPPSTHHLLVIQAARHGKHCLCEKPLALNISQADEMLSVTRQAGTIAPVNFVLRYNPVTDMVKAVLESGLLGKVLRAQMINCASDSKLPHSHWFWDKSESGGIFIEHGVHFFDLYRFWFSRGSVVWAGALTRDGQGMEDRVMCEVLHEGGAIASHYHGFDQPAELDRTTHRIICELGEIVVDGWIPMSMRLAALLDENGQNRLSAIAPSAQVTTEQEISATTAKVFSRGRERSYTRMTSLEYKIDATKQTVYSNGVRSLLADQIAFLGDAAHPRRINERNGLLALELAQEADAFASTPGAKAA